MTNTLLSHHKYLRISPRLFLQDFLKLAMYCAVLLYMVLVKGTFKMLPIQESEMAQLNHDQQSIVSIKYLAQHLALEFPLKGYFMLTFVCSLLALGILIK